MPQDSTRYLTLQVSEETHEQLRTLARRLAMPNATVVAHAISAMHTRLAPEPLAGNERARLRRRGTLSPEKEAELERDRLLFEEAMAYACSEDDSERLFPYPKGSSPRNS